MTDVDGIDDLPVDPQFQINIETEFKSWRALACKEAKPIPEIPLSVATSNAMGARLIRELRESWETYRQHDEQVVFELPREEILKRSHQLLVSVREARERCYKWLERIVSATRHSVTDKILEIMGRHMQLTMADIMQSVLDKSFILILAPCLPSSARERWNETCLSLLELCVLEDKLVRIVGSTTVTQILEECQTIHQPWRSTEHPYWLVFEVQGRLQIRHEQYVIAKHLIDHPGSICQLNMGRGKTRVILPMLFLYYSYKPLQSSTGKDIVRANVLSSLLSETRDFMWRVLTSGVLQVPFIEMPFNRSISLGPHELLVLRHVLTEATRNGAILMVAPEHRLSLELKRVEMRERLPATELQILDEVLDPLRYVDIFDESDAVLHHGYHLVYAVGDSVALDGGANRWLPAQALLRILLSDKSVRIRQFLQRFSDLCSFRPEYLVRSGDSSGGGIFNGFQLNKNHDADGTTEYEDDFTQFRLALVEDLIDNAPFDLVWIQAFSRNSEMRKKLQCQGPSTRVTGIALVWGLENCLQKRYRVNYGHPVPDSRPKALAIPFQAADIPAERSEFSHPDVAIVLTLLAFYHSGLTTQQLRRAFEVLLSLDSSVKSRYYCEWYQSIAGSIQDTDDREMLMDLSHISLENTEQFKKVYATYRYAIEVINFYVNYCVFPTDTRQFSSRLSRSAWDLVRGYHNVGFSGTNDTHPLLPHGVKQHEPQEPHLRATNGKMIHMLLEATRNYQVLGDGTPVEYEIVTTRACWESLLQLAVEKKCDALIDTGALLAGVTNHDAATYLMDLPGFSKLGVTYYDTRPKFDGWVVVVKDHGLVHPHKTSSLRECDTFVIFDEARARGSDMKLLLQAVALLTLGPQITKDKLMQGAGRLRQLGKHRQTLELTSTHDVYLNIVHQQQKNGGAKSVPCIIDVLNWVIDNTQRQCTSGLLEWAQSGLQFHKKEVDETCEVQPEDWTLESLYAGAQEKTLISTVIEEKVTTTLTQFQQSTASVHSALKTIRQRGDTFGSQDHVGVTHLGGECERELQVEEEQEEERECVRPPLNPNTESVWDWKRLLSASSAHDLDVLSIEDAVKKWLYPRECCAIAWGRTQIFGTHNFWKTLEPISTSEDVSWTSNLRQIHGIICFGDGNVLLLSEMEEDAVRRMLQDERLNHKASTTLGGSFALVQLPFVVGYLRRMENCTSLTVHLASIPLAVGWNHGSPVVPESLLVPFLTVMACCLLNGDTDLFLDCHPNQAESVLEELLRSLCHREEALHTFISLRGFTSRWKRSYLHGICKRMDLEDDVTKT